MHDEDKWSWPYAVFRIGFGAAIMFTVLALVFAMFGSPS